MQRLLAALAPFALAVLLAGQTPPAPPTPSVGELPLLCSDEADQVVAVGRDYKAVFASDGVTVVPRTGALAPSLPLLLRPLAATLAGRALPLPTTGFTRDGERCERHSAAFTERYDLAVDSLEQSFVFAALPQRGELVVDVGVATALPAVPQADGRSLRFVHEHATLTFDRAVAFDARGARRELAIAWHGDGYRLVVPADFVATAQLPLVVDPVITTTVLSGNRLRDNTDLVWVPTTQRFVAVFDEQFASNDLDVYAVAMNADGALISVLAVDTTTITARNPAIAYERDLDRLLVVYEHGPLPTIRGRFLLNLGIGTLNTSFEIAGPGTGDTTTVDPDVAGNQTVGAALPRFLVVWTNQPGSGSTVRGRLVGDLAAMTTPSQLGPAGVSAASITPTRDNQPYWFVAMQYEFSTMDNDLLGVLVSALSGTWSGILSIDSSTRNTRFPEVAAPMVLGNGTYYLCAAHEQVGSTWDIALDLVDPNGNLAAAANLTQLETTDPSIRAATQLYPRVAHDGTTFAVGYMEIGPSSTGLDGYVAFLRATETSLSLVDGRVPLGTSSANERSFALAGNASPRRFLGAFCRTAQGANTTDIVLPRLAPAVPEVRATGCLGLTATAEGQTLLGETLMFALQPGAVGGFFAGLPTAAAPLPDCSCQVGLLPQVLVPSPFLLTIPTTPTIVGVQIAVQGFDLGGSCLGAFRLSDTFDVTVR